MVNEKTYQRDKQYVPVCSNTYPYRNYLKSNGLVWNPSTKGWQGELGKGKVWFVTHKLGLIVVNGNDKSQA
jgi:hypothetical protein